MAFLLEADLCSKIENCSSKRLLWKTLNTILDVKESRLVEQCLMNMTMMTTTWTKKRNKTLKRSFGVYRKLNQSSVDIWKSFKQLRKKEKKRGNEAEATQIVVKVWTWEKIGNWWAGLGEEATNNEDISTRWKRIDGGSGARLEKIRWRKPSEKKMKKKFVCVSILDIRGLSWESNTRERLFTFCRQPVFSNQNVVPDV